MLTDWLQDWQREDENRSPDSISWFMFNWRWKRLIKTLQSGIEAKHFELWELPGQCFLITLTPHKCYTRTPFCTTDIKHPLVLRYIPTEQQSYHYWNAGQDVHTLLLRVFCGNLTKHPSCKAITPIVISISVCMSAEGNH